MSEEAALVWSLALSGTNLAVFALTGRLSPRTRAVGWILAVATEPLWAFYGYVTGGWAFAGLAGVYAVVAAVNLRTLLRSQPAESRTES
jgi:hypothetical protein